MRVDGNQLTTRGHPDEAGRMARKVAKKRSAAGATRKKAAPKPKVAGKKIAPQTGQAQPSKTRGKAKPQVLDTAAFPPESLVESTLGLCLACALNVLTRHLGLSPERARTEIRRYNPVLEELTSTSPSRPYFAWPAEACPYCEAPPKWHAPLKIVRIEGGKTTDTARRALVKELAGSPNFAVLEEKSTERDALYGWLAKTGASLNLESPSWLNEAARHWLWRRLPKENWAAILQHAPVVRRSRRLDDGFEHEGGRLYLAPPLFDEILLI